MENKFGPLIEGMVLSYYGVHNMILKSWETIADESGKDTLWMSFNTVYTTEANIKAVPITAENIGTYFELDEGHSGKNHVIMVGKSGSSKRRISLMLYPNGRHQIWFAVAVIFVFEYVHELQLYIAGLGCDHTVKIENYE